MKWKMTSVSPQGVDAFSILLFGIIVLSITLLSMLIIVRPSYCVKDMPSV
jgi:hypothetical protein